MSLRSELAAEWRETGRITQVALSSTLALTVGFLGFAGKVLHDSYQPSKAAQATADCPKPDQAEIGRRKQAILDAVNSAPETISPLEHEDRLGEIRRKNGVSFIALNYFINKARQSKSIEGAIAATNDATSSYFGFETTATIDPANPNKTREDAIQLLGILSTTPMELTKTIGIDEVRLGSPEPAKVPVYDGVAAAFTNRTYHDSERQVITLGPGNVWAFNHEKGHQTQWTRNALICGNPYTSDHIDPSFAAANPSNFRYQYPATGWQGVTRDWYPATGLPEDEADAHDALLTPDGGCAAAK